MSWSPDGQQIVTATTHVLEEAVRVWRTDTGAHLRTVTKDHQGLRTVAWSPDGRLIAMCGHVDVTICDAETGRPVRRLDDTDRAGLDPAVWSPDGRYLAVPDREQAMRIWNTHTGVAAGKLAIADGGEQVRSVCWSRDGQFLLTVGTEATVAIWDATTGAPLLTVPTPRMNTTAVDWAPDGRHTVTASDDGTVTVWS
jgi:WD40 repeat protein